MVISHNLAAMNAERQFNIVTDKRKKAMEKLSSGYRINRASDDAAGLAISEKMRRQIRGLTQGVQNTQDGVSMCQIADGALDEVSEMLHRITELSVKSANGTNSAEDRKYIQKEVSNLLLEIDRVSETTTFNEQKIFCEAQPSDPVQVDPSLTPATSTVAFNGYRVASNGSVHTVQSGDTVDQDSTYYKTSSVSDIRNVGGTITYTAKRTFYTSNKKYSTGDVVNRSEIENKTLFSARADQTLIKGYDIIQGEFKALRNLQFFNESTNTLNTAVTGQDLLNDYDYPHYLDRIKEGPLIVGLKTAQPYVLVEPSGKLTESNEGSLLSKSITGGSLISDEDVYVLNMSDGSIKKLDSGSDLTGYVKSNGQGKDNYVVIQYPAVDMTNPSSTGGNTTTYTDGVNTFWIQSGAEEGDGFYLNFGRMDTNTLGINGLDVSSVAGATNAIERSKAAVIRLNDIRSTIGAQQNRLEHTIANENNVIENTTVAESRIRDTDMSKEIVQNSVQDILSQAGIAMMSQANQSNQGVLSLLQ